MSNLRQLWVDKYRPNDVDSYIFHDSSHKAAIIRMIINGSIPNLLFSGIQGTGKSSLARLLLRELNVDECDILQINASSSTSVDMVRERIEPFITSFAIGEFKVILLEEADALSHAAQKSLKVLTEDYADFVRFIFTTNEEHKINAAIKSRFQQFRFKAHSKTLVKRMMAEILATEKVQYDEEVLEDYIESAYPDIRKVIHLLEQNSMTGTLVATSGTAENAEYKSKMLECIEKDEWFDMSIKVLPFVTSQDWDEAYTHLYTNLHKSPALSADDGKMATAVVLIAEYLYRQSLCSDPIINAHALMIRLSQI